MNRIKQIGVVFALCSLLWSGMLTCMDANQLTGNQDPAQVSIFVFIGPPGSGKGTLSQLCVERLGWKHLSTGALCRKHIAEGTIIGKHIELAKKAGKLIDDALILEMVSQWFDVLGDNHENIIFDGFPRTPLQAQAFKNVLNAKFANYNFTVVQFHISDAQVVERLASRFVCSNKNCEAIYAIKSGELKQMLCARCGSLLERRSDDQPSTITQRLVTYHTYAKPLFDLYHELGEQIILLEADKSLETVFQEFLLAVASK